MAIQAILGEGSNGRVRLSSRVEGGQCCDPAGTLQGLDRIDAQAGGQVGLRAEGITQAGDRARVSGLDAAGGALDVVAIIRRRAAVTVIPAARGLYDGEIGRVLTAPHRAVGQVRVQGQALAAVTQHAAERLDRMRAADLRQVGVAGQAVFHLTGQHGCQSDGLRFSALLPENYQQSEQEQRGSGEKGTAHEGKKG